MRNPGGPGGPGPPQYFGKIYTEISEKGYFEIFIALLGPPQYLSCCARSGLGCHCDHLKNVEEKVRLMYTFLLYIRIHLICFISNRSKIGIVELFEIQLVVA